MKNVAEAVSSGLRLRQGAQKPYERKLQSGEFLDTDDQDELVDDLHAQSKFLNSVWRAILVGFGFFLISVNVWVILSLVLQGHTVVYLNRVLFPSLGAAKLLILEVTSLVAFGSSLAYAIQIPARSDLPQVTAIVASGVSVVMYSVFVLMSPGFTFKDCYIPVFNAFYTVICLYVDKSARTFDSQMAELGNMRYKLASA